MLNFDKISCCVSKVQIKTINVIELVKSCYDPCYKIYIKKLFLFLALEFPFAEAWTWSKKTIYENWKKRLENNKPTFSLRKLQFVLSMMQLIMICLYRYNEWVNSFTEKVQFTIMIILSESMIVFSLCAMVNTVQSLKFSLMVSCICSSVLKHMVYDRSRI